MKSKMVILTAIFVFVLSGSAKSAEPSFTIEVIPRTQVMRVGEPFVFKLKYKFEQPRISPADGQIRKYYHELEEQNMLYSYSYIQHFLYKESSEENRDLITFLNIASYILPPCRLRLVYVLLL